MKIKIKDAHKKLKGFDRLEFLIKYSHISETISCCVILQWLAMIAAIIFLTNDNLTFSLIFMMISIGIYFTGIITTHIFEKKLINQFFDIKTK